MSVFEVIVGKHRDPVRIWGINDIKEFHLTKPNAEHPDLHKLVVTTKAPTSHDFFFKEPAKAEQAHADIEAAQQTGESVRLVLHEDINKHLLHPDKR